MSADHDPLCPFHGVCPQSGAEHRGAGWGTGECRCGADGCDCDLIARVRADERQRARQRVEAALAEVKAALNNYPRLTARDGAQEAENAVLRALAAGGDA